jgi:hypothetical protein
MRSGTTLQEAVKWFEDNRIPLWNVNQNNEQQTWTTSNKAYAHIYIDDAALGAPLVPGWGGERPYIDWEMVEVLLVDLFT